MLKTCGEIDRFSPLVDFFLLVLDSRAPFSSYYPETVKDRKKLIIVLNKSDLIEKDDLKKTRDIFKKLHPVFAVSAISPESCRKMISELKKTFKKNILYLMVIGMPNVGKSLLIRSLTGKKINTGARAGVTTQVSWLAGSDGVKFADTPGVLSPRIEDEKLFARLSLIQALGEKLMEPELSAGFLLEKYRSLPELYKKRYGEKPAETDQECYSQISQKFRLGDDTAVARDFLIRDFQQGKLGRVMLDEFQDFTFEI